jgi:heat shock protein HslJ
MKFAKGNVTIFGGINRVSGSYALVGESVTMGSLISTRMAGPPELMALENGFLTVLRSVDSFHVHGNDLELMSKGAVVAKLRSAK